MKIALTPALLLAGCAAGTQSAPSLLPRAIESRSNAEPVRAATDVPGDAAVDREVAARVATFDATARAFDAAATATERKVAVAERAAKGSDRWLDAQAAISEIGQARAASDAALADIEALAIARGTKGLPPYPALDAAIARAQAEVTRQGSVDAALKTRLPL